MSSLSYRQTGCGFDGSQIAVILIAALSVSVLQCTRREWRMDGDGDPDPARQAAIRYIIIENTIYAHRYRKRSSSEEEDANTQDNTSRQKDLRTRHVFPPGNAGMLIRQKSRFTQNESFLIIIVDIQKSVLQ